MKRLAKQVVRDGFFNQITKIHYADPVRYIPHDTHIVSNEKISKLFCFF